MKSFFTFFLILFISINTNAQDDSKLIPYKKGYKYGYCDKNKKIVIPVQYDNAYPFGYRTNFSSNEDLANVQIGNEMFLINKKGEILYKERDFDKKEREENMTTPKIEEVRTILFYTFKENGLTGIKDENENTIVKPSFESITIYKFPNSYKNLINEKYYQPTFASVYSNGNSSIIRLDKMKIYENYDVRSYIINDDFMIIENKSNIYGLLFEDKIIMVDPKFIEISSYYPEQQLIYVSKIVENHPYNFYINFDGTEYYE